VTIEEEVWQNVSQIVAGFPLLECDRCATTGDLFEVLHKIEKSLGVYIGDESINQNYFQS
jgi:hypothetical protein